MRPSHLKRNPFRFHGFRVCVRWLSILYEIVSNRLMVSCAHIVSIYAATEWEAAVCTTMSGENNVRNENVNIVGEHTDIPTYSSIARFLRWLLAVIIISLLLRVQAFKNISHNLSMPDITLVYTIYVVFIFRNSALVMACNCRRSPSPSRHRNSLEMSTAALQRRRISSIYALYAAVQLCRELWCTVA